MAVFLERENSNLNPQPWLGPAVSMLMQPIHNTHVATQPYGPYRLIQSKCC